MPKALLEDIGLDIGQDVELTVNLGKIIIHLMVVGVLHEKRYFLLAPFV